MNSERWIMPEWMKKYIPFFPIVSHPYPRVIDKIQEAINTPVNLQNNSREECLAIVRLLENLHSAGALVEPRKPGRIDFTDSWPSAVPIK